MIKRQQSSDKVYTTRTNSAIKSKLPTVQLFPYSDLSCESHTAKIVSFSFKKQKNVMFVILTYFIMSVAGAFHYFHI
jgi:hypothetical protein